MLALCLTQAKVDAWCEVRLAFALQSGSALTIAAAAARPPGPPPAIATSTSGTCFIVLPEIGSGWKRQTRADCYRKRANASQAAPVLREPAGSTRRLILRAIGAPSARATGKESTRATTQLLPSVQLEARQSNDRDVLDIILLYHLVYLGRFQYHSRFLVEGLWHRKWCLNFQEVELELHLMSQ